MINLEKVLDAKGKISSKRLKFLTQEELSFIEQQSSMLQLNPTITNKLKFIFSGKIEHEKCFCGNFLPYAKSASNVFLDFCCMSCSKKINNNPQKFKETLEKNKTEFKEKLESCDIILPIEQVSKFLTDNLNVFKNGGNKSSSLLKDNIEILNSINFYSKEDSLTQKIFNILYGKSYCSCGNVCSFLSLEKGYNKACYSCGKEKSREKKKENSTKLAIEYISKFNEFELVEYPLGLQTPFKLLHKKCNKEFEKWFNNGKLNSHVILCPNCNNKSISSYEIEISDWLNSLGITVKQQFSIENKKFDICVEDKKLIIEFHGLKQHSFGFDTYSRFNNFDKEDKTIHLKRTELCEKYGFSCLQIFENEWIKNKELWKSVIKSKLGLSEQKIFARKCVIKEISQKECDDFLNRTHLQGTVNAKFKLGLFFNNKLVCCMTLSKPRFSKLYDFEILRFSSELNTTVIGGFSKLLKYFKTKNSGTIISYANRRWSTGNVYTNNNFNYINNSDPNYFYLNSSCTEIYSRNKYQKHKIKQLYDKGSLQFFDENLSETLNMYHNKFRKIYDCGNLLFVC